MIAKSHTLFCAGFIAVALIASAHVVHAQSASDTLVYTLVDAAGSTEALYRSTDGKLVFRRNSQGGSDERGDTSFYVRETWPKSAMTAVSLDDSFDTVDDIVITISTTPNAIYREHNAGGETSTSQRSEELLEFPKSEAATAKRALSELKSFAGP